MTAFLTHGRIMGGVIATPDLDASLADYHGRLGLDLVEMAAVPTALADSWGAPGVAGARMATLQPASGAHCFLRLVEQPLPVGFKPTTTFGWGAYEITVQDVFSWRETLRDSGFRTIGEPREIPSMPFFVAMQMLGHGDEMIYLNEVRMMMANTDLPHAQSPIDHIFIVILAAPDRKAAVAWYRDVLMMDEVDTHIIEYTMINKAFELPAGTTSALTMIQKGRMPIVEVDDYPAQAQHRDVGRGVLPPGNALVSLAVDSLDPIDAQWIAPPQVHAGSLYGGRRSAMTVGPAGEWLELIECG